MSFPAGARLQGHYWLKQLQETFAAVSLLPDSVCARLFESVVCPLRKTEPWRIPF